MDKRKIEKGSNGEGVYWIRISKDRKHYQRIAYNYIKSIVKKTNHTQCNVLISDEDGSCFLDNAIIFRFSLS